MTTTPASNMTQTEIQAWMAEQKRRPDSRAIKDRTCSVCDTPITRYSKTGRCRVDGRVAPLIEQQHCSKCGQKIAGDGKTGMCQRCAAHANSQRGKQAHRPTARQRLIIGGTVRPKVRALEPGACVHHWMCEPQKDFEIRSKCKKCGEERVFPDEAIANESVTYIRRSRGWMNEPLPDNGAFGGRILFRGIE